MNEKQFIDFIKKSLNEKDQLIKIETKLKSFNKKIGKI